MLYLRGMLKYSIKLLLFDKPNDRGELPVYIRITIQRKTTYMATGVYLQTKDWDAGKETIKSYYPNAGAINADLQARKSAIIKYCSEQQLAGRQVTAQQIKQAFTRGNLHNIFEFCEAFVKEVEHKRGGGTLENYRKHLQVVEDFHGSKSLTFEEIDHSCLVRFEHYLRARKKENGDQLGGNYIFAIFKTLRTFFNAARKRGIINHYPFSTFEMPEYIAPNKEYLTLSELDKIEEIARESSNKLTKQACVYFLLGCYTGLRISDWLSFASKDPVRGDRFRLRATKNNEWVTMRIIGRLARHMELVKAVPLTITEQEINRTLKDIAKLCGIRKRITSHTGRHTFAITMCCEQGIGAEVTAELMGITLKTCVQNYYKITNTRIDRDTIKAWGEL